MDVLIKSSNGITQVSANAKLLSKRKVFVEGEIPLEEACEFIKKIMILNEEDSIKPIDVLINSPGGDVNSGMVMYDVIQASKGSSKNAYRSGNSVQKRPVPSYNHEIRNSEEYSLQENYR